LARHEDAAEILRGDLGEAKALNIKAAAIYN
jgi:hypothetical protein